IAFSLGPIPVGPGIPGAPVQEIQLGIESPRHPGRSAAGFPRVALPGFTARLASDGHSVEPPSSPPGGCVIRIEEASNPKLPTGTSDDDLVLHDKRRTGDREADRWVRHSRVPNYRTSFSIQGEQTGIQGPNEHPISENRDAAVLLATAQ